MMTTIKPILEQSVRYREFYVSQALNEKFSGILPHGIYRGFKLKPSASLMHVIVANDEDWATSVAIVERNGCSITVIMRDAGEVRIPSIGVWFVCIEAYYSTKQPGYQRIVVKAEADLEPHHVVVGKVSVNTFDETLEPIDISMVTDADRTQCNPLGTLSPDGRKELELLKNELNSIVEASKDEQENAIDQAKKWAENPVDEPVGHEASGDPLYSARHWAHQASESSVPLASADARGGIRVNGSGLILEELDKLSVNTGDGLGFDDTGKLVVNVATEDTLGIARVATQAEVDAGVTGKNSPAFVTPETLPLPEIYKVARLYALDEEEPPVGFLVASGALIQGADTLYPLLWAALQDPSNAWRVVTEPQWQALSSVTRDVGGVQVPTWDGVGGVTKFVINLEAKTIRLPDTRGMVREAAGFDGLEVGGVHGEGIQNIKSVGTSMHGHSAGPTTNNPPFYMPTYSNNHPAFVAHSTWRYGQYGFDASLVVKTSPQTQSRARGDLDCVYVGE